MALESSTLPGPSTGKVAVTVGDEFKNVLLSLRAKYEKVKDQLDVEYVEQSNEMHVG